MRTLLIIEDDQILQEMYKDKFQKNGFTVELANDGEEGLRKALQLHPHLILLDLAMPNMTGTIVMEKLRDDEWGKNVPIVILTNLNVDGTLLSKVVQNHPAFCLMKVGVTPEDVLTKAKEILHI